MEHPASQKTLNNRFESFRDETQLIAAVICAAGSSSRMGGIKKELQKLDNNITVLGAAVGAFLAVPSVNIIVIAVSKDGESAARQALPPEYFIKHKTKILFIEGGETRRASVFSALACLSSYNPRYVLIHDGARPRVSPSLIEKTIDAVKKYGAVIPLLPLTDTPKELEIRNEKREINSEQPVIGNEDIEAVVYIKRHLGRANVGAAQTPQAFKFPEILHAHEKASEALMNNPGEEFTDDAEVWGRFCGQVAVIPGEPENKKITFPEDLN
ncbi:MAG: 2-C-methyl-D-erythritol 4-phosphate cytidylyltransferase [Treponema sp.]|nr:2-C-methyl-D-erythritol 4-phosphate cytidylyltransferase [Treponema sp.]